MPSASTWIVLTLALAACGARQHAQPSRPPAEFCAAVIAGELDRAGQSAHGAIVEAKANDSTDASQPLAAWLRTQPCVAAVTVPPEVIDTEPGIREIGFELKPDADGSVRRCVADLVLAPGGRVGIHPASHSTNNPDTHCTVVPAPPDLAGIRAALAPHAALRFDTASTTDRGCPTDQSLGEYIAMLVQNTTPKPGSKDEYRLTGTCGEFPTELATIDPPADPAYWYCRLDAYTLDAESGDPWHYELRLRILKADGTPDVTTFGCPGTP